MLCIQRKKRDPFGDCLVDPCAQCTRPAGWAEPVAERLRCSAGAPPAGFRLPPDDDAVVVAEGLGDLRPLELQHG